jgi:hypothetical protein
MPVALTEILIGDEPASWAAAGFAVEGDRCLVGSVTLRFEPGERRGVLGWTLDGLTDAGDLDGIPTAAPDPGTEPGAAPGAAGSPPAHPNGVTALDHVVVATPDLDRTISALEAAGIEARRSRDVGGGRRQVFFWIGEPILELVGPVEPTGDGPARVWGLACTCPDLDASVAALGDAVGAAKDAVQPGRRIATIRHKDLDVTVPVALMSPHVRPDQVDD